MELVKHVLTQHGLDHFGFAKLTAPLTLSYYEDWLRDHYHGDMGYLADHLELKRHPQKLLTKAASAIVFTEPYGELPAEPSFPLKHLKVASYARREDYHRWLRLKVFNLCSDLKKIFPEHDFLGFTDSSPVLERDLAHRAGLGWFGKNTCLLDRKKGSLFYIAEIYTTLNLETPATLPTDHCGTCTRCIDACPTHAIEPGKKLNATRCISYWTIESRKIPPPDLRENFQGWFFGCDICQTVCPWNLKVNDIAVVDETPVSRVEELRWVLTNSNNFLQKTLAATPLSRTGGRGLKRNALIVIANLKLQELKTEVEAYRQDAELGELSRWTLQKLDE